MKKYYECHVTLIGDANSIKPVVEELGWIFSSIQNDICLGEGIKCYATKHFSCSKFSQDEVIEKVLATAENLRILDHDVIRSKVELVVYDSRSADCTINFK